LRITFKTTGGVAYFPGLAAPRAVDVSALPADRQQEIQSLLDESRFFELPPRTPARRGAADYQTYTITVTDGDRQHSVEVSDPVPPQLERLVDLLRELTEPH
jgi:emfourin